MLLDVCCIIQMYKLKPYGSISEKEPTTKARIY